MKDLEQKVYTFDVKGIVNPELIKVYKDGRVISAGNRDLVLADLFVGEFHVEGNRVIGYSIMELFEKRIKDNLISFLDVEANAVTLKEIKNKLIQWADIAVAERQKVILDFIMEDPKQINLDDFKQIQILKKHNYKICKKDDFVFGYKEGEESYLFEIVNGKMIDLPLMEQAKSTEYTKIYSAKERLTVFYNVIENTIEISL